jgi:hypothetical protein
MTDRKASVFLCDEVLYNLTGKVMIQGLYTTGDIAIPTNELKTNQLVFVFSIETPIEKPLTSVSLRVTFPESVPNFFTMPVAPHNPLLLTDPRRKTISFTQAFLIQQPILKPGEIKTAVIHDEGEIDSGSIWITSVASWPTSTH